METTSGSAARSLERGCRKGKGSILLAVPVVFERAAQIANFLKLIFGGGVLEPHDHFNCGVAIQPLQILGDLGVGGLVDFVGLLLLTTEGQIGSQQDAKREPTQASPPGCTAGETRGGCATNLWKFRRHGGGFPSNPRTFH